MQICIYIYVYMYICIYVYMYICPSPYRCGSEKSKWLCIVETSRASMLAVVNNNQKKNMNYRSWRNGVLSNFWFCIVCGMFKTMAMFMHEDLQVRCTSTPNPCSSLRNSARNTRCLIWI